MRDTFMTTKGKPLAWAAVLLLAGCAFNVVGVKQVPVEFTSMPAVTHQFVLLEEVKAKMGTGFPTHLKSGTQWHQTGNTEFGAVFATDDQIVTVEASNIYEAQIVVTNQMLTGFYLPVDDRFTPLARPIRIETETVHPKEPEGL